MDSITGRGSGSASNAKITLEKTITLIQGRNTIDLLSTTVGLQVLSLFHSGLLAVRDNLKYGTVII